MRMSRATTLLHLLLGLRTSTAATTTTTTTSLTNLRSPATLFAQCAASNLYSYSPNLLRYGSRSLPLAKTYATMSSQSQNQNPSTEQPSNSAQPESQPDASNKDEKPVLALPDSSTATEPELPQLDVNGDGVKLDHLGPLVVNTDGTLARISNWAGMTEMERKNTLRIIGKRNKQRMEKLKAEQGEGSQNQEGQ